MCCLMGKSQDGVVYAAVTKNKTKKQKLETSMAQQSKGHRMPQMG